MTTTDTVLADLLDRTADALFVEADTCTASGLAANFRATRARQWADTFRSAADGDRVAASLVRQFKGG